MSAKSWESGAEQRRRSVEWMTDRAVETAAGADARARAGRAWDDLRAGLLERSGFFRRQFADAGIDLASIALDDVDLGLRLALAPHGLERHRAGAGSTRPAAWDAAPSGFSCVPTRLRP